MKKIFFLSLTGSIRDHALVRGRIRRSISAATGQLLPLAAVASPVAVAGGADPCAGDQGESFIRGSRVGGLARARQHPGAAGTREIGDGGGGRRGLLPGHGDRELPPDDNVVRGGADACFIFLWK